MEPISTAARQARANKQNRTHDEYDLAVKAGVDLHTPYLVTTPNGKEFVAIPTDVRHENRDYFLPSKGQWQRPRTVGRDEFNGGVQVTFDVHDVTNVADAMVKTDGSIRNDTLNTPEIAASELEELEAAEMENTFIRT